MRTTDLFKNNRSSKRLNESLAKTFGTKLDLESFDTPKLEDARNKLRTQIHTARQDSGFNETIENETLTQAQFMHDAIVAELMDRQEHIVDTDVREGPETDPDELFNQWMNSEYAPMDDDSGDDKVVFDKALRFLDGEVPEDDIESYAEELADRFHGGTYDDEGGETDDNYALASAGFGSDEDYESIETEDESSRMSMAQELYKSNPDLDSEDDILNAGFSIMKQRDGAKAARYYFSYDEDFPSDFISEYKWLQRHEHDVGEDVTMERERDPEDWDEGNTEPPNNFAVSINGKQWKVFKGRGQYADDSAERKHYYQLKDWAAKKSESTGKKWTVSITGENPTESINQKEDMNTNEAYINNARDAINLLADIRKQSKMAELGQGDPVRPNQLVNDLYDVMQWIEANMKESVNTESVNTGDIMTRLQEGEVQQASAIVTAKTMVDRVSRWIEELSSMENDTLLQLGDSIRDEMGQEQAKAFISSVAPAIQQALENLKSTRETMATGVRQLTGEEQGAEMLGSDPAAMGGDEMGPAEPDAMNMDGDIGDMGGEDEFAAAEPAAGGLGDAGREQRESINRSSSLLKVLAG